MNEVVQQLKKVRKSSRKMANLSEKQKVSLLNDLAQLILDNAELIKTENKKDLDRMDDADPKKDRLLLTQQRIEDLASSIKDITKLKDPTGQVQYEKTLENGLKVSKISVPVGVVGIIYESRPNVTIDVAALCIRSGNAVVLRGGSDAEFSNKVLVNIIHEALSKYDVPTDTVYLMPTDRKYVQDMLTAVEYVDIIIPRGSQGLIDFVRANSKVPTIETGAGVCHTYVEKTADLDQAAAVVINAKVSRPSVCNSLDTIVVDRKVKNDFLPKITEGLKEYDVEIFADEESYEILKSLDYPNLQKANTEDFGREFLSFKCSVKVVENYDEAVEHISNFSSKHSEAIMTKDTSLMEQFINEIDAASVYTNASTRFTDGGVFGLGAEIGISTQKLHARGPFALEKLTTEKWIVRGDGQVR